MSIQDYCNGRIIKDIDLSSEHYGEVVTKITFVGTDHFVLVRPASQKAVRIELHDGKN